MKSLQEYISNDMKSFKASLDESLLDMDEENADNAVELEAIYHELVEELGISMVYKNRSYTQPITKEDIIIKGNKIFFPDNTLLDLTIFPDTFKKYKIGPIDNLVINNYRGKVSKLPIIQVKNLMVDNCKLDFDKKLNCNHIKLVNCGIDNLKISAKQSWESFECDSDTKYRIFDTYMDKLAPNVKELF